MISPAGFSPTPDPFANQASGRIDFNNIGKTEFLRLLIAQLQHQDPLNPVKNDEFIAQLATFSSLEQLISINEGIQKLAAAADAAGSANIRTAFSRG